MNEDETIPKITEDDIKFLDLFLSNELTEAGLEELDVRLLNSDFEMYYNKRLSEKYNKPIKKVVINYLPMIVMLLTLVLGIYLFLNSN